MSLGLAPRYPQGRRIGLTLMGEKWLGTTFLYFFLLLVHSYALLQPHLMRLSLTIIFLFKFLSCAPLKKCQV